MSGPTYPTSFWPQGDHIGQQQPPQTQQQYRQPHLQLDQHPDLVDQTVNAGGDRRPYLQQLNTQQQHLGSQQTAATNSTAFGSVPYSYQAQNYAAFGQNDGVAETKGGTSRLERSKKSHQKVAKELR